MPTPEFNPADPQFQLSTEFPPDKGDSWKSKPIESDGWVLSHKAIRGEIATFLKVLKAIGARGDKLQEWEVFILQSTFKIHYDHIEGHHHNEDDIYSPVLKTRIKLGDKVEADHQGLMDKMDQVRNAVNKLEAGNSIMDLTKLMNEYKAIMEPHLKEEEDEVLPLLRLYFTPKDLEPAVKQIIDKNTKLDNGTFVYHQTEEFFRNTFMPQEHIPSFVWYIAFKPALKAFVKNFADPLKAVEAGRELSSGNEFCNIL